MSHAMLWILVGYFAILQWPQQAGLVSPAGFSSKVPASTYPPKKNATAPVAITALSHLFIEITSLSYGDCIIILNLNRTSNWADSKASLPFTVSEAISGTAAAGGTTPGIQQNDTGQRDGVQDARLDVVGPLSGQTDRPWSCHDGLRLKWVRARS